MITRTFFFFARQFERMPFVNFSQSGRLLHCVTKGVDSKNGATKINDRPVNWVNWYSNKSTGFILKAHWL